MTSSFAERALRDQTQDIIKIGRVSRIDRDAWPYRCDVVVREHSYSFELTDVVIAAPFLDGNDLGLGVWPTPVAPPDSGQIVIVLCSDGLLDGQKYVIGQVPDPDLLAAPIRYVDVAVPDKSKIFTHTDGRKYLQADILARDNEGHATLVGVLLSDEVAPVRVYYRHNATG